MGADSEFQSVEDLQSVDRELRAAVTGLGSNSGVATILICNELDIPWVSVTHEGSSEANLSLICGDTDFRVDAISSTLPELEAGEVRPVLGVTEETEVPMFPEIGTTADLGYPELGSVSSLRATLRHPPIFPRMLGIRWRKLSKTL